MYARLLRTATKDNLQKVLEDCNDPLIVISHFPLSFVGIANNSLIRLRDALSDLTQPSLSQLQLLGMLFCYLSQDMTARSTKSSGLSNDDTLIQRLLEELKEMTLVETQLTEWMQKASLLNPILIWHLLYEVFTASPTQFALHNLMIAQGVVMCLVYFSHMYEYTNKSRKYARL